MVNKLTLKSGREVSYEKPNLRNKAKIFDGFQAANAKGISISLDNCIDICMLCKVELTEKELDDNYTFEEMFLIGSHVLNESFEQELNKKKLK